jgi:hypothetical protein
VFVGTLVALAVAGVVLRLYLGHLVAQTADGLTGLLDSTTASGLSRACEDAIRHSSADVSVACAGEDRDAVTRFTESFKP